MQIREQLYKAGELGTTVMIGLGKARKLPGKLMNSSLKFVDDMKVSSLKRAESLLDTVSAKASKIATKFDDFAFDTVRVADTGFGNVLIKDSVRLSDTPLGGRVQQMFTKLSDDAAEMSNSVAKASDGARAVKSQTLEEFLKEMEELPRTRLSQKLEDGIVSTTNGKRPIPSVYMSRKAIDTHLSLFDDGVVKIQSKESFENAIRRYGSSIGDPETGTYVLPKNIIDKAIGASDGNPRVLEQLLGLEQGYLGDVPVLLDIKKMDGIRVPTGNESGAWQGLWVPGGFTKGGIPEAVIDQIPSEGYTVTDVFK